MVGRDLSHRFPPKDNVPGEAVMEMYKPISIK
jgi:hypothetical protein